MVNNLKICRVKLGLSQKDVANRLGIATSPYSGWETEPQKIKIKNAKELAQVFGESLDFLFLD